MSIRWTEEEAKQRGYKQDDKGDWHSPKASRTSPLKEAKKVEAQLCDAINLRLRDSGQSALSKSSQGDDSKGKNGTSQKRTQKSRKSLSRENDAGKRYRIRVTSFRLRDFDPDNIYSKWYVDQLVKAKIIPDDSSKYVDCVTKWVIPVATAEEERTLVEVYEYDYP